MKNISILFALFIMTSCAAQKKEKISGNKNVTTVNKEITDAFSVLDIDDGLRVTIKQGQSDSYVLVTDENLIPVIDLDVRGNTLYVKTSKQIKGSKQLDIYLTVNSLTDIVLKNDARIQSTGPLSFSTLALTGQHSSRFELDLDTEKLTINLLDKSSGDLTINSDKATILLNGRTDLDAKLKARELTLTLQKNAGISLKGNAKEALINLTGSTDLKGKRFDVNDADISMADKANVEIKVSDNLTLYAKDRSKIELYGSPEIDMKGLDDKATITKK